MVNPRARERLPASGQLEERGPDTGQVALSVWRRESKSLNSCNPAAHSFCWALSLRNLRQQRTDAGGWVVPGLPTTPQDGVVIWIVTGANTRVDV